MTANFFLRKWSTSRPGFLAVLTASVIAAVGVGIASYSVKIMRLNVGPEAIVPSFGEEYSGWAAGAVAAFAYVLTGAYLLRLRSASRNPFVRAFCLVAAFASGVVCPLAVETAMRVTLGSDSGFAFVCVIPGPFLQWSGWGLGLVAISVDSALGHARPAEIGANARVG